MKILAIDTSTDNAGLAIIENESVLAESTWNTGRTHTTELLPRLDTLLNSISLNIDNIDGIACAVGPGSFNGLRVGISTTKGLALVNNLPCVGINTLEAIEKAYDNKYQNLCITLPAGRREVAYFNKSNATSKIGEISLLAQDINEPTYFVGEIKEDLKEELIKLIKDNYLEINEKVLSRVAMVGILGEKELKKNNNHNASLLKALYLKRPNITKPKKYHYNQE